MTRRRWLLAGGGIGGALASAALFSVKGYQPSTARRLLKAPLAPPRLDRWRVVGPGGGGAQFKPAISPHDEKLVLVTCDMGGSYLSEDGGMLWRMINLRERAHFIRFDPSDANVIYIGAHLCVYRSEDRGRTWKLLLPDPGGFRIHFIDDEGDVAVTSNERLGVVHALAVAPFDKNRLYFAAGRTIYTSKDRGRRYTELATCESDCLELEVDPASTPDLPALYAVGRNWAAVWRGGKWSAGAVSPRVNFRGTSIAFSKDGSAAIYATVNFEKSAAGYSGGLIVSHDGGATWESHAEGVARLGDPGTKPPLLFAVTAAPSDPAVVYLSYQDLSIGGELYQGVARSTDGGKTWALVLKNSRQFAPNISEAWLAERFNADWPDNPKAMAVSPKNPDLCYATDDGRSIRTTNGGKTWEQLYAQCLEDGTYTSSGLDVTTTYGVHFDPFDQNRIFMTCTDVGLFRSENGSRSWRPSNFGCPPEWKNTTYAVDFDPAEQGLMWAAMSGTHDLPRRKMCCDPDKYKGGICVSRDGGQNWTVASKGLPPIAATDILVDPNSPARARVLYATGYGRGVFKSADGGVTWALKNAGIETQDPLTWRLALDGRGSLYVVVGRVKAAEPGSPGDGAVYRSTDGGESWSRLPLPKGFNGPNGIAIDPQNPQRLYLACWPHYGKSTNGLPMDGGVLLSEDGGHEWRNVLMLDQHIADVTVDPGNPGVVYAAGFECSVWRSGDRGATWKRVRGFNFKGAHRVIPDPNDPAMIYVTTFGGGVWHGPAEGDESAAEDIVTPEASFHRQAGSGTG